jgi:hypothetical protein
MQISQNVKNLILRAIGAFAIATSFLNFTDYTELVTWLFAIPILLPAAFFSVLGITDFLSAMLFWFSKGRVAKATIYNEPFVRKAAENAIVPQVQHLAELAMSALLSTILWFVAGILLLSFGIMPAGLPLLAGLFFIVYTSSPFRLFLTLIKRTPEKYWTEKEEQELREIIDMLEKKPENVEKAKERLDALIKRKK